MRTEAPETPIEAARRALLEGEFVVYPTDTVYGIGCRADDADAIRRLFDVKGLPEQRGVSVLFATVDEARAWTAWTPTADRLAEAFLPGPLTLVLDAADRAPAALSPDEGTLAVRLVDRPEARSLARTSPIVATSANRHGDPTARTVGDAREAFGDAIAAYVDGGRLEGEASTVVDARTEQPTVLREGPLSRAETLEAAKRG